MNPFIALRMAAPDARARTVEEHDEIIRALEKRDRKLCMAAMEAHRASTSTGLPPEL